MRYRSKLMHGVALSILAVLSSMSTAHAQQSLQKIDIGESRRAAPGLAISRASAGGPFGPAVPLTDVRAADTGDRITGYKADRTVSVKLNKPIFHIPIAVKTVMRQTMDDQQSVSLYQAVVGDVSSVTLMNQGCSRFQSLTIRGLTTGTTTMSHLYLDGSLMPNVNCPATANIGKIEIVKGQASMARQIN